MASRPLTPQERVDLARAAAILADAGRFRTSIMVLGAVEDDAHPALPAAELAHLEPGEVARGWGG